MMREELQILFARHHSNQGKRRQSCRPKGSHRYSFRTIFSLIEPFPGAAQDGKDDRKAPKNSMPTDLRSRSELAREAGRKGAVMEISDYRVSVSAIPASSVAAEPATAALARQFACVRALCAERPLDDEQIHYRQTL